MPKDKDQTPALGWDEVDPIIPPTDEVEAAIRPTNLGTTHKERECDAASAEQLPLAEAEGLTRAQPSDIRAAELEPTYRTSERRLRSAEESNLSREKEYDSADSKLRIFVNRPEHAKVIYWRLSRVSWNLRWRSPT